MKRITEDEAIALITFERGGFVKARFSFRLVTENDKYDGRSEAASSSTAAATGQKKRIKALIIQFL